MYMLSIHTFTADFTFATNVSFSTVCFAIYLLAQKNSFIDIEIVKVGWWMKVVYSRYNLPEKCHSFDMLADLCRELVDMVKLFSYQIYSPIQPYKSLLEFKTMDWWFPSDVERKQQKNSENFAHLQLGINVRLNLCFSDSSCAKSHFR